MKKVIIAYIPVLHAGYKNFLKNNPQAQTLYILGSELIAEFDHLQRKDLRALPPKLIQKSLQNWDLNQKIKIANKKTLAKLNTPETQITTPDETEMDEICKRYLNQAQIKKDSVFLRYDNKKSLKKDKVNPAVTITKNKLLQKNMSQAQKEALKSSDWWRQVGAIITQNGQIILTDFNHHVPDQKMPYINGDPRGNFHKGEHLDLATAFHAEASLVAQAAKKGISLEGTELYVTTFPCPTCAKLVAYSGIKKIYFKTGYTLLDGESILKSQGVEIIQIK